MRALPSILLAALVAGCTAPPLKKPPERIVVTPELIDAFRDSVYANYDVRLLVDPAAPMNGNPDALLALARENERTKREKLVEALAEAGSTKARSAPNDRLSDLAPILADAFGRRDRYAFIFEGQPRSEPVEAGHSPTEEERLGSIIKAGSLSLVRLVEPHQERDATIFGHPFHYELYVHEKPLIEDYPTYRARRSAPGSSITRPAVTLGNRIYLDRDAAARIGEEKFFPKILAYERLSVAALASDAPFVEAKSVPQLLAVVKDVLRWRSLESFWATIRAQPPEDQVRLFARDYGLREEPRAVCEAYELQAAGATASSPPGEEQLVAIEKRTYLGAIVHGEPLGQVATIAGLAGDLQGTKGQPLDPSVRARLRAARDVVVLLCEALALGQPGPANPADGAAIELARLARAPAGQLQEIAAAAYAELNAKRNTKQ